MTQSLPPEYYEQLEALQAIDFALVELTLYLDTHPTDIEAMVQFNQLAYESKKLKQTFEAQFGALQQFGNSYTDENWSWGTSPWPWQI